MNGTSTTHRIPETDGRILSFAFFCFPNSFRIQFTISDRWPFHRAHSYAMTTQRNTCKITMLPSDALAWIYLHAILSDISPLRYSAQGPSIILCCCPSRPFRDSISSLHVGTSPCSPFPRAEGGSQAREAPPVTTSTNPSRPPHPGFLLCCLLKWEREDSHVGSLFLLRIFSGPASNTICKCN